MKVKTLADVTEFAGKLVTIKVGQWLCCIGRVSNEILPFESGPGYNVDISVDTNPSYYTLTQDILSKNDVRLDTMEENETNC